MLFSSALRKCFQHFLTSSLFDDHSSPGLKPWGFLVILINDADDTGNNVHTIAPFDIFTANKAGMGDLEWEVWNNDHIGSLEQEIDLLDQTLFASQQMLSESETVRPESALKDVSEPKSMNSLRDNEHPHLEENVTIKELLNLLIVTHENGKLSANCPIQGCEKSVSTKHEQQLIDCMARHLKYSKHNIKSPLPRLPNKIPVDAIVCSENPIPIYSNQNGVYCVCPFSCRESFRAENLISLEMSLCKHGKNTHRLTPQAINQIIKQPDDIPDNFKIPHSTHLKTTDPVTLYANYNNKKWHAMCPIGKKKCKAIFAENKAKVICKVRTHLSAFHKKKLAEINQLVPFKRGGPYKK